MENQEAQASKGERTVPQPLTLAETGFDVGPSLWKAVASEGSDRHEKTKGAVGQLRNHTGLRAHGEQSPLD